MLSARVVCLVCLVLPAVLLGCSCQSVEVGVPPPDDITGVSVVGKLFYGPRDLLPWIKPGELLPITEEFLKVVDADGPAERESIGFLLLAASYLNTKTPGYVPDGEAELFRTPIETYHVGGDCEDRSFLYVSFLRAVGYTGPLALAQGETKGGRHMWVVASLPGYRHVTIDTGSEFMVCWMYFDGVEIGIVFCGEAYILVDVP